jgi:hypothetical protein
VTHLASERLAGIAMLPHGDPERQAAEEHARTCPQCGRALEAARGGLAALDALAPAPVPPALEGVRARVSAALAEDARSVLREGLIVLVGAAFVSAICFYRFPIVSEGLQPLLETALAVIAAAVVALSAANRHRARIGLALVSVVSAILLALDVDGTADASPAHGAYCGSIVAITALVPAAVAAWLSLASLEPSRPMRNAARAAAAALIAQGVLVLICDQRSALHLLPFHVGAVAASAGVGALLPALLGRLRRTEQGAR